MIDLIKEMVVRYGVRVHAFVLMPNHYHIVLEAPERNLSRAMQWLNVGYSVWFNRRHRRAGHLFQGRFRAEILEPADAALEVTRYVHLNPVRIRSMGLSKRARAIEDLGLGSAPSHEEIRDRLRRLRSYPWSSFPDYVSKRPLHEWVETAATLNLVGGAVDGRKEWYREYVEAALRAGFPETPWDRLSAGLVIGGDAFVKRVRQTARGDEREQKSLRYLKNPGGLTFEQVVRAVERIKGESWPLFRDRYGDWGRDAVLYLARRRGRLTLSELADRSDLANYMAVSVAVSRFGRRLSADRNLAAIVDDVNRQLINV
jgi:hypothetical protein